MNDVDRHAPGSASPDFDQDPPGPSARLYVHEAGWQVRIKRGSERAFCHMMAPDQDYYHRLLDGEIYLHQAEERICLDCASRRGVISMEPRRLRGDKPVFLPGTDEPPIRLADSDEE